MLVFTLLLTICSVIAALLSLVWMCASRSHMAALAGAAVCFLLSAALAYFSFGAWGRARLVEQCGESLSSLGAAVEAFKICTEKYPTKLEVLVPFYFDDLPACPLEPDPLQSGYALEYQTADDNFTICCRGNRHTGWGGTAEGYPRYTAEKGLELR